MLVRPAYGPRLVTGGREADARRVEEEAGVAGLGGAGSVLDGGWGVKGSGGGALEFEVEGGGTGGGRGGVRWVGEKGTRTS